MDQKELREAILAELEGSQWQYAGELADTLGCTLKEANEALEKLLRRRKVDRHDCWPGDHEWSLAEPAEAKEEFA